MPVTSNDIANQAIQMMGDNQSPVTGLYPNFDASAAGKALNKIYGPCVQTVGRQFEWDMARNQVALGLSGNAAPLGWLYEYIYPTNGVQLWQLVPATITDPNNPIPTTWSVGNALVSSVQTKVIWSNLQNALCIYNNNPSENTWDPIFREAVVRLLASELAIAIGGRPETSQLLLQSGSAFESIGEVRTD